MESLRYRLGSLPDSTKLTFGKVYSDVKEGLKGLAQGLKVTVEHVYEILVKQQVVNAIVWLSMLLLSFVSLVIAMKAFKSKEEWWSKDDGKPTWVGLIRVIQIMSSIILLIIGICCINSVVTGFVNPEYGAIKEIFNFVNGKH